MGEDAIRLLEDRARRQQEKLDLIEALDAIRDGVADPPAMLTAIVTTLAERFSTDFCLLCLHDRETGRLEMKAMVDRSGALASLSAEQVRALGEHAAAAEGITAWAAPPEGLKMLAGQHLAAVPIIMGPAQRLGALLLGRAPRPFGAEDLDLLATAESQLDSAVIQGYAYHDLSQRNKELQVIYNVDRIRDRQLPFNQMLNAVLAELRAVIESEVGFIMLYNRAAGGSLELRAVSESDLFRLSRFYEQVEALAHQSLQRAELISETDPESELRSVMCVPLILRDEIIGVFGLANSPRPGGFGEDDRRMLSAIASQMDTAIFESLEARRLRRLLGRSVGPNVMERLLRASDTEFLKGERATLSVLYADLRGSTELARRTEPELLVGFVNDYLSHMTRVVLRHDGTLDKFVGDEVMALFGAPVPQADHALRAVRVGLEMVHEHHTVMRAWEGRGVQPVPIGVGIATGELIVGEFGSSIRSDYTVIGHAANLGARICSTALADQVLICEHTYGLVREKVAAEPIEGLHFKGIDEPLTVYHVRALAR